MTVYDCFRILELPRNAGLEELRFAYRDKAKKYHPDRKGGDSRQFTRLHEAYTFLLDYGPFKRGSLNEGKTGQEARTRQAEREAYRRAEEERKRREERMEKARRAAEEKMAREKLQRQKREAERKARIRAEEAEKARAAKEKQKRAESQTPAHRARLAGEILSGTGSDREKLKAVDTLVSLKRKSVYPYLKKGLYSNSERVVIASIDAIGTLKIIQAGPELSSLICSGSPGIRRAVLGAVESFPNLKPYAGIIRMALSDGKISIRQKAEELRGRLNG